MSIFHPNFYFKRAAAISPAFLRERGVTVLLLDVDNTLTTHNSPAVSPEITDWLARLAAADVRLLILSNNNAARVEPFAKGLGLGCIARAAKPLSGGVRRACERLGVPREGVAIVGDQIFTDVLCANLAGAVSILVEPIEPEEMLFFKIKRVLEKWVLRGFVKGE